jgi:hypothetical protein
MATGDRGWLRSSSRPQPDSSTQSTAIFLIPTSRAGHAPANAGAARYVSASMRLSGAQGTDGQVQSEVAE